MSMSNIRDENLIFIDETGINLHQSQNYGYSPIGQKAYITVPSNRGRNISLLCAITFENGLIAHQIIRGSFNGELLANFITNILHPALQPHQNIVVMDNAKFHHSPCVREAINQSGLSHRYVPPYSPQLNPIEQYFSQIKSFINSDPEKCSNSSQLMIKIERILHSNYIDCRGFYREMRRWIEQALGRNIFL